VKASEINSTLGKGYNFLIGMSLLLILAFKIDSMPADAIANESLQDHMVAYLPEPRSSLSRQKLHE
jgi:hypothetical protein